MFKGKKGFSLVELMIVVAIIGILVAALLPQLQNMISSAKESNAKQSLKSLADAITRFNAVEPRECQNLQWLVPNYMQEVKRDPWGSPYSIDYKNGVIVSAGPDKELGDVTDTMDIARRDNIEFYYKAKLGISEAKLSLDVDGNSKLNNGDRITLFFTRTAKTTSGTTAVAVSNQDFIFCDRFEDDKVNEVWFYNNSPAGYPSGSNPAGYMWDDKLMDYITDLDGTPFQPSDFALRPILSDGSVSTGANGEQLLGNDKDTYVTFGLIAPTDFELDAELFVRFAPGSIAPQTGKYKDSRGNVAIGNGYNVKIETYF